MALLDPDQLAAMRETAAATLDQLGTVERIQKADDGALGKTRSHTPALVDIPCRLNTRNAVEQVNTPEGARYVSVTRWEVKLPFDTDIRPTDRLLIGGERFEVQEGDAGRINATLLVLSLRRAK